MGLKLCVPLVTMRDMPIVHMTHQGVDETTYETLWKVKPEVRRKATKTKYITLVVFHTGKHVVCGIVKMYQDEIVESKL